MSGPTYGTALVAEFGRSVREAEHKLANEANRHARDARGRIIAENLDKAVALERTIRTADAHFAAGNPGQALALIRDARIALDRPHMVPL